MKAKAPYLVLMGEFIVLDEGSETAKAYWAQRSIALNDTYLVNRLELDVNEDVGIIVLIGLISLLLRLLMVQQ